MRVERLGRRDRFQTARSSAARRARRRPRGRGPAAACGSDRRPADRRRSHRGSRRPARRCAAPADPASVCRTLPGLAIVHQAPRRSGRSTRTARSAALQQHRAAVRTRVRLIEGRDEGLGRRGREREQSVVSCRRQRKRLRGGKRFVWQRLSTMRRRLCVYRIGPFVNYAG